MSDVGIVVSDGPGPPYVKTEIASGMTLIMSDEDSAYCDEGERVLKVASRRHGEDWKLTSAGKRMRFVVMENGSLVKRPLG